LGWFPQKPREYFEQARRIVIDEKTRLRARFLQFKFHAIDQSLLEAAMGRGDRRYAEIVETAWRRGARFDLWDDCFDYGVWRRAAEQAGVDLEAAARRRFGREEVLPWEHLGGPSKAYLLTHCDSVEEAVEAMPSDPP